jgi:hypothetical protein
MFKFHQSPADLNVLELLRQPAKMLELSEIRKLVLEELHAFQVALMSSRLSMKASLKQKPEVSDAHQLLHQFAAANNHSYH